MPKTRTAFKRKNRYSFELDREDVQTLYDMLSGAYIAAGNMPKYSPAKLSAIIICDFIRRNAAKFAVAFEPKIKFTLSPAEAYALHFMLREFYCDVPGEQRVAYDILSQFDAEIQYLL